MGGSQHPLWTPQIVTLETRWRYIERQTTTTTSSITKTTKKHPEESGHAPKVPQPTGHAHFANHQSEERKVEQDHAHSVPVIHTQVPSGGHAHPSHHHSTSNHTQPPYNQDLSHAHSGYNQDPGHAHNSFKSDPGEEELVSYATIVKKTLLNGSHAPSRPPEPEKRIPIGGFNYLKPTPAPQPDPEPDPEPIDHQFEDSKNLALEQQGKQLYQV